MLERLIQHLMRGGSYGHIWMKQSALTQWWKTSEPLPQIPQVAEDLYFGVHPSRSSKGPKERTRNEDIEAINCLYADIDCKLFENDRALTIKHIKKLEPRPSVIVDSGGGYHCYWLLTNPFKLEGSFAHDLAATLQEDWVRFVGGDPAVHDLARILRLPGTFNLKYEPPRPVSIAYCNFNLLYELEYLIELVPSVPDHSGDDEEEETDGAIPPAAFPNQLSLQEIVERAQQSAQGQKFRLLWSGYSGGYESQSEADLAFCCMLAFWTGGEYEKMDKLFRASGRMRDKWERDDYRYSTLINAIGQQKEYYIDPGDFLLAGANDEGNAQCVFARYKDKFAHCEALGWLQFTGTHWGSEGAEVSLDRRITETLCERRAAAAKATNRDPKRLEEIIRAAKPSAHNVSSCKRQLLSLLHADLNEFDTSLDELNCPNGVLNLRTGELTPHSPTKKFTYCIGTPYDPDADPSFWVEWLTEAVGGDQDVVDFLQIALGYSITGRTEEETMFYIHGLARAGKGIFTETMIHLLGGRPLATEVGMEMFLEKRNPSDQGFDLAGLKAARFVAASESSESGWLDSARLKRWTGNNLITCAHKYGRPFTYAPTFKIWLTSNFEPQMDADDIAAWSRVQVIHFPNSWLGNEDKTLKQKMRSPEVLSGLLAWLVEGAKKWYRLPKEGLRAPESVKQETRRARGKLDWVSLWAEEVLLRTDSPNDRISNASIYESYKEWCLENGVSPKKMTSLTRSLNRMGFENTLYRSGDNVFRGWQGVKLRRGTFGQQLAAIGDQPQAATMTTEGAGSVE